MVGSAKTEAQATRRIALLEEAKMALRFPYDSQLVQDFREGGGRWDPSTKSWIFSLYALPRVRNILAERAKETGKTSLLSFDGMSEVEEAYTSALTRAQEAIENSPLLLREQKEDAFRILEAFLRAMEGSGPKGYVLANGTGTGKTYVYGGFVRALRALGLEALLVVPNEDLARQVQEVLRGLKTEAKVSTYGTFAPDEVKDRVLILDEAHLAKRGFRSDRGKRVWKGVRQALFTLFSTATPFDKPWESEYLLVPTGALETWGEPSFDEFMRRFKVYTRETPWGEGREYYFAGGVRELVAFHETLKGWGFLTRRIFLPPEGLVEHEVVRLEIPKEEALLLAEVRRRLKEAATAAPPEERGIIAAYRTMLSRALLERMKTRVSFELLEGLIQEGWHVALFFQYRSDKELDFSTPEGVLTYLSEAEERQAEVLARRIVPALRGLKLQLPSPVALIRERFEYLGEALGFYTGAETQGQLKRTKEAWNKGEIRLLTLTAAKGGTGLSLHDVRGNRPTAQMVMTLPWTGSALDQVLGRVIRVGVASPVRVIFPVAPVPAERRMASVVAESLRTLGYAVRGGEMPIPEEVIQGFLYDLPSLDPGGFQRLLSGPGGGDES